VFVGGFTAINGHNIALLRIELHAPEYAPIFQGVGQARNNFNNDDDDNNSNKLIIILDAISLMLLHCCKA